MSAPLLLPAFADTPLHTASELAIRRIQYSVGQDFQPNATAATIHAHDLFPISAAWLACSAQLLTPPPPVPSLPQPSPVTRKPSMKVLRKTARSKRKPATGKTKPSPSA